MLNLHRYRWTIVPVSKAAGAVPATGTATKLPKPEGYKPPHAFDSHLDPNTGGYRVGTVRRWRKGPHIKLQDGWHLYDHKKGKVVVGDKWVDLKGHAADVSPKEHSIHPRPHKIRKEAKGLYDTLSRINGLKNGKTYPGFAEEMAAVPGKLEHLVTNARHYMEDVMDELAARGEDNEDLATAELNLEEAEAGLERLQSNVTLADLYTATNHTRKALDSLSSLAGELPASRPTPPAANHSREVLSNVEGDAKLQALAVDKVKSARMLGVQGFMSTVILGETESGKKVIIKNDSASRQAGAVPEAAMYELSKVLGIGNLPATLLSAEPMLNETVAYAAESRMSTGDPIEHDQKSATTTQEFIEGDVLEDLKKVSDRLTPGQIDQLVDLVALDRVAGNCDRNLGNVIISKDGKLWGIDGGYAFEEVAFGASELNVPEDLKKLLGRLANDRPAELLAANKKAATRLQEVNRSRDRVRLHLGKSTKLSKEQVDLSIKSLNETASTGIIIPERFLRVAEENMRKQT